MFPALSALQRIIIGIGMLMILAVDNNYSYRHLNIISWDSVSLTANRFQGLSKRTKSPEANHHPRSILDSSVLKKI